jgi:O-antigen ligase
VGGVLLFGLQGILADRLILNPAAFARLPLNGLAWQMFQEHPLVGVGANNFIAASSEFLTVDWTRVWLHTVHNKYLLVMAETGILGFIAFGWFLSSAVLGGWRGYRLGDSVIGPLALGFTAGLVGNMVHMFADVFHGRPDTVMLWLVIGVLAALDTRFLPAVTTRAIRPLPIHAGTDA